MERFELKRMLLEIPSIVYSLDYFRIIKEIEFENVYGIFSYNNKFTFK